MLLETIKFDKAIHPSYFKQSLKRDSIELFKLNFKVLFNRINETEGEEHNKNIVADFLKNTFYQNTNEINTSGRKDLVIHKGNSSQTPVAVIIEAKSPMNKSEMISYEKTNAKALHETIHYYLHERLIKENKEIKHLIITNIYDWFIFDATEFEKMLNVKTKQSLSLRQTYMDWFDKKLVGTSTDWFYSEIAKPFVENEIEKLECVHLNLRDYSEIVKNTDPTDDNRLINIYKILSPEHLLKLPYTNDYNKIDVAFYNELLYILGLEETKDGAKKIITRVKEKNRKIGSLLENTINTIQVRHRLKRIERLDLFGETETEQVFSIALELCITWLNRILFLKLLEAQLIKYHKGNPEFAFLNISKIKDFDEVDELFFEVLAVKPENRTASVTEKFGDLPYLNSSLFEITELEGNALQISELKDRLTLPVYSSTVLKDDIKRKTGDLNTLEYLLEFLNSFNFASDAKAEIQDDNKTIINAAVLGLIFEKINGYKDGSFYTPSFITSYISREILKSTIVEKFRNLPNFKNPEDFEQLKDLIDYTDKEERQKANEIINSIKICDPAVGSGHFLVSILNELITIKSELKILQYPNGNRIKGIKIANVNDELEIIDEETSEPFQYTVNEKGQPVSELQNLQKALFNEKRLLIEKCLFGVDINPKSVLICRLRLWIELLKSSFYTEQSKYKFLETLPNIDINIVAGNSLISKFDTGLNIFEKQAVNQLIKIYKINVNAYKNETDYENKDKYRTTIKNIKSELLKYATPQDKHYKEFIKKTRELQNFIGIKPQTAQIQKQIVKLSEEVAEHEKKYLANYHHVYANSLEWALEFPEILTDEGSFIGFDIVLGNPPYFSISNEPKLKEVSQNYTIYKPSADIYTLFIERGIQILKPEGKLCMITSNKWLRTAYGESLRNYLLSSAKIELLIDFGTVRVFDVATVDTNIIFVAKQKPENKNVKAVGFQKSFDPENDNIDKYITENTIELTNLTSESWNIIVESEYSLKSKIEKIGKPIISFGIEINRGIVTGFNEAFIIDTQKRDELLKKDPKNKEIIKPLVRGIDIHRYGVNYKDLHIITTFPTKKIDIEEYHKLKEHFETFGKRLYQTGEEGCRKKTKHKWFETQDNIAYHEDFEMEKIMWQAITKKFDFYYDTQGMYSDVTTFIMTGQNLKYILAILNSKMFTYCMDNIYLLGDTFRSKNLILQNFPIPEIKEENKPVVSEIETLVNEILTLKQNNIETNITKQTKEIDKLVYKLYELTDDEIRMIEE
jgi:type II restriction/modification system DNA methylase subunit YeeA